ncbi:MAG: hypothetical protein ABIJ41_02020 [Candidatus Omnitrophota bacterium]
MTKPHVLIFFLITLVLAGRPGCQNLNSQETGDNETRLKALAKKEFHYDVVVRLCKRTLSVYLPLKENLFEYKTVEKNAAGRPFSVQYLTNDYADGAFKIEYDIIPMTKQPEGNGLTSAYTENYNSAYRNLFSAVSRIYLDVPVPPEFFKLTIADIREGIAVTHTFYFDDLKRYQVNSLPQEEYTQRILTDSAGEKRLVNDTKGETIGCVPLSLGAFLAEQITARINFKYTQSDFTPSADTQKEILTIVASVVKYYDFSQLKDVTLHDLRSHQKASVGPLQLKSFQQ